MKTLWAVACAAVVIGGLILVSGGCATSRTKSNEAKPPGQPAPYGQVSDKPLSPDNVTVSYGPNYLIGPEDILYISVWENKELTLEVVVRPDGKISVPLVQDVQAEGLTAAELSNVLQVKLLAFLKAPQVSVIVKQVNAPRIFVLGYVARPGVYPLRSDMSILQALSLAGGFTQFASPRSIKLVRGTGSKQEVRKINYYKLLDDEAEGNYLLKPGDTIVVP